MVDITYRLRNTTDPEERLEDACMWKALKDEHGENISLTESNDLFNEKSLFGSRHRNQCESELPYWGDPVFLEHAGRKIEVVSIDGADEVIKRFHKNGDVFAKSTKSKHCITKVPVGEKLFQNNPEMAYSFLDTPIKLIIQEYKKMEFETRIFIIDRKIVTSSPVAWHLTPLDFETVKKEHYKFKTPKSQLPLIKPHNWMGYMLDIADKFKWKNLVVDIALINDGKDLCVVECNPIVLGSVGLYACDVRALAKASHSLIADGENYMFAT